MSKAFFLLAILLPNVLWAFQTNQYLSYHQHITKAEEYIAKKQFSESLHIYRKLSEEYEHVFLRDCKVAAQLAAYINDPDNVFYFLERGMKKGWTLKEINKSKYFKKYKTDARWAVLKDNQDIFKEHSFLHINAKYRSEVKKMFIQDQKRALRVALTPVKKWKDRYTTHTFVPNNRLQVRRINAMIDESGFPGEKIIGDKSWATVIVSHNEHDSIYKQLRPKLYQAFGRGEISAIDLAIIETWRTVVDTDRRDKSFIIWDTEVSTAEAMHADSLRQSIGLRTIALNNKLILLEKELKMNFYLSPFLGGLITIKD